MKYDEKSCGAVTYTRAGEEIYYLLVQNRAGNCGFPKGHVEKGETEEETARREIGEETGIDAELIAGFRREYAYTLDNGRRKLGVYFLARYSGTEPAAMNETGRVWSVPYGEAVRLLEYEKDRDILAEADAFIKSGGHDREDCSEK